jgi:glycosyltransferase involved in cell wall biosynthesis
MKVLFATNHAYLPHHVGGSESSTHDLCLTLRERGVDAAVMSALFPRGLLAAGRRLAFVLRPQDRVVRDDSLGYRVFRCKQPAAAVRTVVDEFGPSVAVLQAGRPLALVDRFTSVGVPCAVYLRDAWFDDLGGTVSQRAGVRYLATSRDLSRRFEEAFGILALNIPPLVRPERYLIESTRQNVTFVCPFPSKGVDIALGLAARRPDIPFVFLESWQLPPLRRMLLNAQIRAAPNISLRRPIADMRTVYRDAKVLLVPSRCPEAWGRVVSEAQLSGIPILASHTGGLPESVGPGGILIHPTASLGQWERALTQIWDDQARYERLAELARQHASRADFQPTAIIERLLGALSELSKMRIG